jgi:cbb3-type cytochrome oxidase subunit 3
MDVASACYLGVTFLLFIIFAAIVARTYSRKRKKKGEAPKYRMMDDDD